VKKKVVLTFFFMALTGFGLWPLHGLGLRDAKDNRWIWLVAADPGDTFSIRYTHSVYQRPVWDIYFIDSRYRIILEETVFPAYGYGLPFSTEKDQVFRVRKDGNFSISNIKRPIPSLHLRVQRQYGNILTFNGKTTLNLSSGVGNGVIEVKIHEFNRIQYLYRGMKRWLIQSI
jgi:hypothetical protein